MSNLKTSVYALIEEIAAAEKITRRALAAASREILIYVPESNDIDCVNRLLNILTPMNRRVAILYFGAFLPWVQEKDTEGNFTRFGKKMEGDKKVAAHMASITEWLADETNDIWTWGDANIELKQKDLKAPVSRAVKIALEGHEKSNTPAVPAHDVIRAVFDGGLTLEDMMAATEAMRLQVEEAQAKMEATDDMAEAA